LLSIGKKEWIFKLLEHYHVQKCDHAQILTQIYINDHDAIAVNQFISLFSHVQYLYAQHIIQKYIFEPSCRSFIKKHAAIVEDYAPTNIGEGCNRRILRSKKLVTRAAIIKYYAPQKY